MPIEENLTYLQKTALKGEIGFALSTSAHDAEMKFRTYLILKEVEEKFRPFIIECVKEEVTFDESIIDRIYLEVLTNTIPVWLWIEEIIADIKLQLATAETGYSVLTGNRLSIDRLQERKNLIESAFLLFTREAIIISPNSAEQLLDQILDDYDLDFLHKACFYLKTCCAEVKMIKGPESSEVPDELMSCIFDIKKIMSFSVETKALNAFNRAAQKDSKFKKMTNLPLPTADNEEIALKGNFVINGTITHEELSNYISEKIVELFGGTTPANSSPNKVYVVKKVFTDSGITTDIRTCQTREEAINFIQKIIEEYPELMNVCEFKVCAENRENNEKNK